MKSHIFATYHQLALHAKLAWSYMNRKSLWASFAASRFSAYKKGSPIWNSINHLIVHPQEHSIWHFKDGLTKVEEFCDHHNCLIPIGCRNLTMKDVLSNENHRFGLLSDLPEEIAKHNRAVTFSEGANYLVWKGSPSCIFTTKDFITSFRTQYSKVPWGKLLWRQWISPKICIIVWKATYNGLPLDHNIRRMGIQIASICPLCCEDEETINHLLFQCLVSRPAWRLLANAFLCGHPETLTSVASRWVSFTSKNFIDAWKSSIALSCIWETWKLRNSVIFENKIFDLLSRVRLGETLRESNPVWYGYQVV